VTFGISKIFSGYLYDIADILLKHYSHNLTLFWLPIWYL